MKRITDPTFKYVPSAHTNLKATFARIRREQQAQRRDEKVTKLNDRRQS